MDLRRRFGVSASAGRAAVGPSPPGREAAVVGVRSPAEITSDAGLLAARVPDRLRADLAAEGLLPVDRIPG
jgi:hypothetical protein